MSWFRELTGFSETTWEDTRAKLEVLDGRLVSKVNGRSWAIGTLETPSLTELRERRRRLPATGRPRLRNLRADAHALHTELGSRGALFQVASQFNLLEMPGPEVTPEDGVTNYVHDHTQGPACAMAAAPATIYRNYFADTGAGFGQTAHRQVNALRDLAEALAPGQVPVRNGYALPTPATLRAIAATLAACDPGRIDALRGLLRIGLHRGAEVTASGPGQGQRVSQAFCSALPVAYGQGSTQDWEPFARLVLEASYEATLAAAAENAAIGGSPTVFLTLVGGGVFGNERDWILDAIYRALGTVEQALDVAIVSYAGVSADLVALEREWNSVPAPVRPDVAHDGDIAPRPHGNCYWLARGRILAGEYPGAPTVPRTRARLAAHLDAGVRRFIDLTREDDALLPYRDIVAELAAERGVEVTYIRRSIPDLGVPTPGELRATLDLLHAPHEGVTYVH